MTMQWLRPYTPGRGRWLVIGWELVALAILGSATENLFRLTGTAFIALAIGFAAVWVVGAFRIMRMGVYVSGYGVRVRGLFRTQTLAWQDVEHIRLHQASHRLGRLEIPSGMTVLIERRDGGHVQTPLWAQGIDFHRRPGLFRSVYQELRDRHALARLAPA
ncbi:PH domain-containing protein [Micromonospora sp. CPCC 205371]|nr:PH domain-containing protein [Micromonospora sp. CPCC 205371]